MLVASTCASPIVTKLDGLRKCVSEGDIGRQGHTCAKTGWQDRVFTELQGRGGDCKEVQQTNLSDDNSVGHFPTSSLTNRDGLAFLGEAEEPAALSKSGDFFSAPSEHVALCVLRSSLTFQSLLSDSLLPNYDQGTSKVAASKAQIEERVASLEKEEQTVPLDEYRSMLDRMTTKMQGKFAVLQEKVTDSLKLQHAAEQELLNCRRVFDNETAELLMQVEVLTAVKTQLSGQTKELAARCHELEENFEQCCGKDICVICMEAPSNVAFTDCGHMVCCDRCAVALPQCPMCRGPVQNWIRIYRS